MNENNLMTQCKSKTELCNKVIADFEHHSFVDSVARTHNMKLCVMPFDNFVP